MADLLIRDLDDATLRTIAFQAEATGRSVDAVVRDLIRIGLVHDAEGLIAVTKRIRQNASSAPVEDSTAVIRTLRGPL